jgi:hypothetical protein
MVKKIFLILHFTFVLALSQAHSADQKYKEQYEPEDTDSKAFSVQCSFTSFVTSQGIYLFSLFDQDQLFEFTKTTLQSIYLEESFDENKLKQLIQDLRVDNFQTKFMPLFLNKIKEHLSQHILDTATITNDLNTLQKFLDDNKEFIMKSLTPLITSHESQGINHIEQLLQKAHNRFNNAVANNDFNKKLSESALIQKLNTALKEAQTKIDNDLEAFRAKISPSNLLIPTMSILRILFLSLLDAEK